MKPLKDAPFCPISAYGAKRKEHSAQVQSLNL